VSAPIIHRELVSVLRARRTVVLQCLLGLAFALLLAFRWPTEPRMALSGTRSQEIFRTFAYGLLGAVLLLLPVFPATSIVREKIRGTLALLLNSPLGPVRIFCGKLFGVLGLAAIILAISVPAAGACYALGGIGFGRQFLGTYAILGLTAVELTALGLLVSSFAASIDSAIRWTYAFVFGLCVLVLVPYHFFVGSGGLLADVVEWLRCLSPLAALMALLGGADVGSRGVVSGADLPQRFGLLSIGFSLLCALWTMSRLNYRIFDKAWTAGVAVDDRSLRERVSRRLLFIVDPERRSRSIGPLVNPVMVKEFRCRRFGRLHWLLRLVAVCAVASLALTILTATRTVDWDVPTIGAIMVVLQVALLVLITPSLAAGLISAERESGGWTLLQMTPLSIPRIVWGKLLSVILTLLLLLCATLPGYLVMVYIEPGQRFQVQRVVLCLALTALFSMLSCAAIGSFCRRAAVSTVAAYCTLLAICCGPLLLWLGRDAPFGHDLVESALTINPIAAALSVIRVRGFTTYELLPANWWFLGAASLASLVLLLIQTYRVSRPQ
jgi:ABC-type transport system involved in multi-copper enzyme maturation permease subunit